MCTVFAIRNEALVAFLIPWAVFEKAQPVKSDGFEGDLTTFSFVAGITGIMVVLIQTYVLVQYGYCLMLY